MLTDPSLSSQEVSQGLCMCMEVRGQSVEVCSLFTPCGLLGGFRTGGKGIFFFFAKLPCRTLTLIFKNEKQDRKKDAHGIAGAGGGTERHRVQVGCLYRKVS